MLNSLKISNQQEMFPLFIQQLLDILYSFKEKKENRLISCPERNPV
jgi:hypothetical protein